MEGTTDWPKPRAALRVGIGGWVFEPWRRSFYPPGLAHARELQYASRQLSAIEINSTYYSSQKPSTFARWRDETPEGFVFSLKASRFTTNRRVLADAGDSIGRFLHSGIEELGPKLGPIVWQFAPTKRFDPADFGAFVAQLPASLHGIALRHALDVRHESFRCPAYLALARRHGVATVFTDSDDHPSFADATGGFIYTRLMRSSAAHAAGFEPRVLQAYADCGLAWSQGREPEGLPRVEPAQQVAEAMPRDVFMFFISGAKETAPHAAMAVLRIVREALPREGARQPSSEPRDTDRRERAPETEPQMQASTQASS